MNDEIIKLINELYQYDEQFKRKLLMLDANAIRSLAENNYYISDKDCKKQINSINDSKENDKIRLKIKKLYLMLVDEYYNKEAEKIKNR